MAPPLRHISSYAVVAQTHIVTWIITRGWAAGNIKICFINILKQERCVEDWPDDSPQLDPNFKPVRTHFLKLTLENIMNSCLIKIMLKTFKLLNLWYFFSPSQEHWDCEGSRWRSATVRYLTSFNLFIFLIVILNQKVAKSQIFSLGNGRFWWRK